MRYFVPFMVLLLAVGCTSFDSLEPGNNLALENQSNLEKNTLRAFDNLKKVGKATGKWTDEDEVIWKEQRYNVALQLAVNNAWLLVIADAIKSDSLDAGFLKTVLDELPGWIDTGKTIHDLIHTMKK